MEISQLKRIGLTEGEIKVYKALLELGDTTKTELARHSKVSSSKIYEITDRLLMKGIISRVEKEGVAHFSPSNPSRILDFLKSKKSEIEEEEKFVASILPSLLTQYSREKEKVKIEVYQGMSGLKTVFDDIVNECRKGDINYVFGAYKGDELRGGKEFYMKRAELRAKKGIMTRIIFNEDMREEKEAIRFYRSKGYDIKFMFQSTPAEIMTYKNVSIITIFSEEPIIIRIIGEEVAKSFKQYFDVLWKIAKR